MMTSALPPQELHGQHGDGLLVSEGPHGVQQVLPRLRARVRGPREALHVQVAAAFGRRSGTLIFGAYYRKRTPVLYETALVTDQLRYVLGAKWPIMVSQLLTVASHKDVFRGLG